MDVLYPRCAGLDVHKDTVVAAVRIAADGPANTEVRTFDTTTPGLLALSGWLAECGCTPGQTHEISVAGPSLMNDDVPSRRRGEDHVHRKPGSASRWC